MVAWNLQVEAKSKPKEEDEDRGRGNRELCLSYLLKLLLILTVRQTLARTPSVAPNARMHSILSAMVVIVMGLHLNGNAIFIFPFSLLVH
mmetsp:Transcript_8327/g.18124  ORF Transcript_8327/g.18124 Transcript_8327/m.18124 type:complete len:90 (-) Transcript_8327:2077-2346(-)